MSVNRAYKVLHRQGNGLLTLENYLMVVDEEYVVAAIDNLQVRALLEEVKK